MSGFGLMTTLYNTIANVVDSYFLLEMAGYDSPWLWNSHWVDLAA